MYGGGAYDLVGPVGHFSFQTRPVKSGETLALDAVGFGPTNPPVPVGQAFAGAASTTNPVTVAIGGNQRRFSSRALWRPGYIKSTW